MADPVSHTAMMSWMTEELGKNKFLSTESRRETMNHMTLFPEPAGDNRSLSECGWQKDVDGDVRFPWIHKREPVVFHSTTILP